MIFYFAPGGRFGNQLFQLNFLLGIRKPEETILSTNMSRVLDCLTSVEKFHNTQNRLFLKLVDKLIKPFIEFFLVKPRIISSWNEIDGEVVFWKGFISKITYVQGYFQIHGDNDHTLPEIRPEIMERAASFLRSLQQGSTFLFCHVRRTDYINYEVLGKVNPSLSLAYYRSAKLHLESKGRKYFWILLGDEPEFVEPLFQGENYVISKLGPVEDFALMTLCDGGIVSNSTFAWWGAKLSRRNAGVVAPRYWLGWKSKVNYPKKITPDFADLIEVQE